MTKITIVGGCGHVGIPLGLALASRDFDVTLFDINQKAVDTINGRKLPFVEEGAQEILYNHVGKNLRATTDERIIRGQEVVIFGTGTPVDENLNPKVNDVLGVIQRYLPLINDSQLIIMRSTLYPGTVRIIENMLFRKGRKCRLAFCPERILQGKGIEEIYKLPQLVSGTTKEAEDAAAAIFDKIASKIIRITPEEAELAKLMTNSWRYLEFAIANQFYMMAETRGQNFYRIFRAITEDYPRARHFAKAGLTAGPCLFKDTMQLAVFYDNQFFLGHSAMLVNEGLPNMLVQQLKKKMGGTLKNKKIAVLGMTFKANNDDTRESLSFKVKKLLEQQMAYILPSDPYLPDSIPLEQALGEADGFIIGTPHNEYLQLVTNKPGIDCWGILGHGEEPA